MLIVNRPFSLILIFLSFLIFIPRAKAFHSEDHIAITRQAMKEFQACYPGLTTKNEFFILASSNLEEDFNVLRKDLAYSHYFNPYKNLPMLRYDSSVRIQNLSDALKADEDQTILFIHLGHALHHIQDMAVPAHVVPVIHGLYDSFETYPLKNIQFSTNLSCLDLKKQVLQAPDLPALLNKAANESLRSLSEIFVPITKINSTGAKNYSVDSSAFWQTAAGNDFGSYGPLGQHYGDSRIQFSKETVIVPADFYEHFKSHQMQMAVINSWIALYQFHNTVHIAEDPRFEFDAFNPLLLLQIENLDRITRYFYFKDLSLSKPLIK